MYKVTILYLLLCVGLCSTAQQLVRMEYFVDTDPGPGLRTSVPIAGENTTVNQTLSNNVLSEGFHTLYTRTLNSNGEWSLFSRQMFEVRNEALPSVIVYAEYFIDEVGAFGSGHSIPVSQPFENGTLNVSVSLDQLNLTSGFHRLYVVVRDSNGHWSLTSDRTFEVRDSNPNPALVGVEYFFLPDGDPGVGNATFLAFANPVTNDTFELSIPPSQVNPNATSICMRTKNNNGEWSLTTCVATDFNVVPFVAGAMNAGNSTVCNGASPDMQLSVSNAGSLSGTVSYQWFSRPGVVTPSGGTNNWTIVNGATNASYTVNTPQNSTITYACYVSDGASGEGWASGSWTINVLPQLSYGVLPISNELYLGSGTADAMSFTSAPQGSGSFSYAWCRADGLLNAPFSGAPGDGVWELLATTLTPTFQPNVIETSNSTYACFVIPGGNPSCGTGNWAAGATFVTIEPISVNEVYADSNVSLYPNPTTSTFTVKTNGLAWKESAIFDATGRCLLKGPTNAFSWQLNVQDWSAGCYFVAVQMASGETITKSLFVVH